MAASNLTNAAMRDCCSPRDWTGAHDNLSITCDALEEIANSSDSFGTVTQLMRNDECVGKIVVTSYANDMGAKYEVYFTRDDGTMYSLLVTVTPSSSIASPTVQIIAENETGEKKKFETDQDQVGGVPCGRCTESSRWCNDDEIPFDVALAPLPHGEIPTKGDKTLNELLWVLDPAETCMTTPCAHDRHPAITLAAAACLSARLASHSHAVLHVERRRDPLCAVVSV